MKTVFCLITFLIVSFSLQAQENTSSKLPFTPSVKVDSFIFISGQIGMDPKENKLVDHSFEAELRQVMKNLKTQLILHGITFDDLVSTTIYLKDMANYDQLNKVYGEYFKERFPSRTCIAVKDLPANASVEISGIAFAQ